MKTQGSSMHGMHSGARETEPGGAKATASSRTLSRDFKHVVRQPSAATPLSPWVSFAAGLAVGLSVAAAVWLHYSNQALPGPEPSLAAAPASSRAPDDATVEPAEETPVATRAAAVAGAAEPATDLTFYDTLPNMEVDVPVEAPPSTAAPRNDVVLQAGSFKTLDQAEKLQALLQLHGVESRIQRYTADDETWHRVRIGPIASVEELQRIQQKLSEAEVSADRVLPEGEVPPP